MVTGPTRQVTKFTGIPAKPVTLECTLLVSGDGT